MTRLLATEHVDPLPGGDGVAGDGAVLDGEVLDAWTVRCRQRLADLLGPLPHAVPLDLEVLESTPAGGYRRRPCWPCTATARASRWCAGSRRPRRPTATTPCRWSSGAMWCWLRTC